MDRILIPVVVEIPKKGISSIVVEVDLKNSTFKVSDNIPSHWREIAISAVRKHWSQLKRYIERGHQPAIDLITNEIFI
jgi:hypothetical protein